MEPVSAPEKDSAPKKPELDQDLNKVQKGKKGRGSLENPEVYDNVPGHAIPILEQEFDDFDTEAGELPARRADRGAVHRLPPEAGRLRPAPARRADDPGQASVRRRHARADGHASPTWSSSCVPLNKGHITTRQNIQIHHIPLADAAELIREISEAGLSSREGCGNTIRNVTGDPWAGVSEGEPFDITPYAVAYVRYFVRHPTTQLMPRKVKTAFTATDEDRAITGIHDVGFIPKVKEVDGKEVRGVEIRVGGGTSIMPRVAPTLNEFVELDNGDYLKGTEAALRIFDRQEWLRVNRARARIKVLVDKIGIDEFREMVDEELKGDWVAERDFSIDHLLFDDDEEAERAGRPRERSEPRTATAASSTAGRRRNVKPAAPGGLLDRRGQASIRGDLTPRAVPRPRPDHARLHRRLRPHHRPPELRAALGPRRVRLRRLTRASATSASTDAGADEITDVVSCPGTDSLQARHHQLDGPEPRGRRSGSRRWSIDDPLTRRVHIKMSGCPNGCSQHHIANIGFYGASIKVGDKTIPAYIAHLGGNYEGGEVIYGAPAQGAPARQARPRRGRALAALLRVRPQRRRGVQRLRRAGRHRQVRGAGRRPEDAGRVQRREPDPLHRLEPLRALQGRARRGRVRGLMAHRHWTTPQSRSTPSRSPPSSRTPRPRRPCAGRSRPSTRSSTSPPRSRRRAR